MTQETIVTNIVARSDFSDLIGDLTKVSSRLSVLQSQLATTNRALANQAAQMQKSFANTIRSTGQFSTHFVSLASDVDKFGKSLDSGKMKLGQYYGAWKDHSKTAGGLIRDLAKQQVMMQNAILQPLGKNAQGLMQFNVHVPQGLDEVANKTKIASQEMKIMNKVIQDGANQVINWGKNTQWAGRQLTMGLTLPIVAFGAAAQKAFLEADQQLVRLTKVYGGVAQTSSAELKKVRAEVSATARELAAAYGASYKDSIALAADIAATGKQGNELLKSTAETTRLSILGEVDRQEAMKATLAIQTAFKQNTTELGESINFLNAVENQTSTSLNDLVEAIPKAGPVIQAMGGSIKDLALYMTAMKEGGINASEGANAIKSALASLINPTKVAKEMFTGFGIDLGGIVTKNAGNLTGTILELQAALDKLDPLQKQQAIEQLFGKFQFARMNALFSNLGKQGSQTLQVLDLMKTSSKDLAAIASREMTTMTESASGKYKRALETLKADMAGVGDQFLNVSTKLLNVIDGVIKFFNNLPKPLKSVMTFVAGLTAIAGPIIMLTGLLANFFGYIAKGIFHFKAFLKGGEGFKLLTPEILAAEKAANLMETTFYNDAKAASVLKKAIANLTAELSLLETKANSATVAVGPAIQTSAGAPLKGLAGNQVVVNKNHPLVGQPYTRQMAHLVPAGTEQPGSIFGVVPNPGPVNQKISKNLQMYAPAAMPVVAGVSSIRGVNPGIIPEEAAKWHSMVGALAMQSQSEIKALKTEVAATKTITTELSTSYQALLPEMTRLTGLAADESAIIVGELHAGKITVDAAKAKITALNLDIERMMGQAATAVATAQGRVINLTTVPLTGQPAVTPTGKSNMKELFHKGPTSSLVDTIARNLGVRTSGAGYSRETTFPRVTVAPFLKREKGGNIYDPRKHGATVPGSTSIKYDNTISKLPLNGFVLSQGPSLDPRNKDIVNIAHTGTSGGASGTVDAITTPGETVYTPEVLEANPGLRETLVRVNNGYSYGGNIQGSKNHYGPLNNYTLNLLRSYMTRSSKIGGLKYSNAGKTYINPKTGKTKVSGPTSLSDFEAGSGSISYKKASTRSSKLYSDEDNIAHGITPTVKGQVLGHAWTPQIIRRLRDITGVKDVGPLTNLSRQQLIDMGMTPGAIKDFYRALPTSWVKIPEKFNNIIKAESVPAKDWTPKAPTFTADDMQSLRIFSKDSGKHPLETEALASAAAAKLNTLMQQRAARGQNMSEEVFGKLVNTAHISALRTHGAPSQDPNIKGQKILAKWPAKEDSYQVNRFADITNSNPHQGPLFIGNAKSIAGDLTGNIGKNIYYSDKFGHLGITQGLPSGTREQVAKYVTRAYMQGNKKTLERLAREREEGVTQHKLSLQSIMKALDKKFTGNLYRGVEGSRLHDSFPKEIAEAIKLAQATGDASGLKNLEFILRRSSFSADPYIAKFFTGFQKDGVMINASVLNRNVTPLSEIHPDLKFSAPNGQVWGSKLNGGMLSEKESLMGGKFRIVDFKDGVLKIQSVSGIEPREKGGPVNSGQTYLVGEKGPELFVPKNAGGIISNYQLGGMIRSAKQNYGALDPSVNLNSFTEETARKALKSGNPARAVQAQTWLMQFGKKAIPANGGVPVSKYDPAFVPGKTRGSGTGGAGFTDWQMRGSQRGSFPSFTQPPTMRGLYGETKGIASDATLKAAARMQLAQISAINNLLKAQAKATDVYYKTGVSISKFQSQLRTDVFGAHGLISRSQNPATSYRELFGSARGFATAYAPRLDANGRPIAGTRQGLRALGLSGGNPFTKHPMLTSIAATAGTAYVGQKVAEKNPMLGNVISSVGSMAAFMLPQFLMGRGPGKSALMMKNAMANAKLSGGTVADELKTLKKAKDIETLMSKGKTVAQAEKFLAEGGKVKQAGRVATAGLKVGNAVKGMPALLTAAQTNPYVLVAEAVLSIGQGLWVWKRHSEDIGKANRAVFGPTKKSLEEVGLKYVSINDKLKAYHKQLQLTREAAASSFVDKKGNTVAGLTLNQSQVEAGARDAKKNAKETVQDFNKTYGQKDVVALAASLKQQYVSAGMSIQEATNKIYVMMKASNKGGMAMAAISSQAFKAIVDEGTAADHAIKLVSTAMKNGNVNAEEMATGINNVINSLDQYRYSLVGTKDQAGNVIDENEALKLTLDKIKALKTSNLPLDQKALENLKSQNIELAAILGKNETLATIYAKVALSQSPIASYVNVGSVKTKDAPEVAAGLQGYMETISTLNNASGPFKGLSDRAEKLKTQYTNLTKAATSFSTVKYDKAIEAQEELIKGIKKELDLRLKALDAQQAQADFTTSLKKEQLAYQNALATGDMSGAAQAQLNIQALVRSKQIADAKQAIQDKAQKDMDARQAEIDRINKLKSKGSEAAQNAGVQATNALTEQTALSNFNTALTNVIAKYPIGKDQKLDKVQKKGLSDELALAISTLAKSGTAGKEYADKFNKQYKSLDERIGFLKEMSIGKNGDGGALAMAKVSKDFGTHVEKFATAISNIPGSGFIGSKSNPIVVAAEQQKSIFGGNFNVSKAAAGFSGKAYSAEGTGIGGRKMLVSEQRVVREWAADQDWFAAGVYFGVPDKESGKTYYFQVDQNGKDVNKVSAPGKAMGGTVNGYAPGGKPKGTYVPGLGGYVRGAGTPTSDSILTQMGSGGFVRLSDTEYVHPASSVAYYGTHFMDLVRSKSIPKKFVDSLTGKAPDEYYEYNPITKNKFKKDGSASPYIPRTNVIPDSISFYDTVNLATGGTVNGYATGGKAKDGWLQKWAKNISGQPAAEMFGTAQLLRLVAGLGSKGDALGAAQVPLAFLGSGLGPKIAGNLGKTAFAIPNKLYQLRNQAKVNSMIKSGMWHGSQPTGHMGEDYLQGTNILTGPESHDPYYGMGFFSTTSKREADSYASGLNSFSNWGDSYGSLNKVVGAPRGKYVDFTKGTNSLKWQDYALSKALGVKKNGYIGNFMPENLGDIMNAEGMTGAIMKRINMGRSPLDKENPMWLSWSNPAGVITKEKYAMGGAIPGYATGGLEDSLEAMTSRYIPKNIYRGPSDTYDGPERMQNQLGSFLNELPRDSRLNPYRNNIIPENSPMYTDPRYMDSSGPSRGFKWNRQNDSGIMANMWNMELDPSYLKNKKFAMGGAIPGYVWGGGAWKQFKNFLGNAFSPLGQGYSSFHSGMAAGVAQKNYAMNYSSKPAPQNPAIQNPNPEMVKWATGEGLASAVGESTLVPSAYRLLTGKSEEIFGHKSIGVGLDALGAFGLGAIARKGIKTASAARATNKATKAAEAEARLAAIEAAKPENIAARIKAEIQASFANVDSALLSGKGRLADPLKGKYSYGSYIDSRESAMSDLLRNSKYNNIEQKFADNALNSKVKMLRAKMKATPWAMTSEELEFLANSGKINRNYIAPILPNDPYIVSSIDRIRTANKLSPLDPVGFDTTSNLYKSQQSLKDLLNATLYHGGQLPENNGTIMLDPSKANPSNWFGAPLFATEGRNQAISYLIKNLQENPSLYKIQSSLKPEEVLDLRHGAEPLSKQNPFILSRLLADIRTNDLRIKTKGETKSYWNRDTLYQWLIAQENGESVASLAPGVDRLRPFLQIEGLAPFLKSEGIKAIAHRGGTVLKTPDIFGKDMGPFKNPIGKVDLQKTSGLVKGDTSALGHDVLAYTTVKDSIASIQKSTISRETLAKMLTNMDKRGWHSSEMEQIIEQILMKAKGKGFKTTYSMGGTYNIPQFKKGIEMVPADMLAMIHKNEAVIPEQFNPFNPNSKGNFGGEKVYNIAPVIHASPGMDENAIADIATRKMLDQLKRIQYNEARTNGMGRSF